MSKIKGIRRKTLRMIMAAAKDTHPREFAATLRAKDGIITEIILVPGTISNNSSAMLQFHHLPIDLSIVGSVHSHPTPNASPSDQDLHLFSQKGSVHIIMGFPYSMDSWAAYNRKGEKVELEVL